MVQFFVPKANEQQTWARGNKVKRFEAQSGTASNSEYVASIDENCGWHPAKYFFLKTRFESQLDVNRHAVSAQPIGSFTLNPKKSTN